MVETREKEIWSLSDFLLPPFIPPIYLSGFYLPTKRDPKTEQNKNKKVTRKK